MTGEKPNGGSAFGEFKQLGSALIKHGGLTVRDYFAAKALQGLLACMDLTKGIDDKNVAEAAYLLADAMLQERAK